MISCLVNARSRARSTRVVRYPLRVPRGPIPPDHDVRRLPAGSRSDMLRETCQEDFEQIDVRREDRPPSAWLMMGPPIGLCVLVVLLAWLHTWLGSPLGPAFNSELWGLAKMAIASTVAAGAFGAWARRQNEHALHVIEAAREDRGSAASVASLPRVRQTGPHRAVTGRHRVVVPELEPGEEDERW